MTRRLAACLALLLCLPPARAEGPGLVISELMALNGVYDKGHAWDWVELRNQGGQRLALGGWSLGDGEEAERRFVFPEGSRLDAGDQLVIWCRGDGGGSVPGGPYYAPFKLDGDGETLTLRDTQGSLVQELSFPAQYGNISYGLTEAGYRYLEQASMGEANSARGFEARTEAPEITPGGFFEGEAVVSMAASPGAVVRYTLDGSEPTARSKAYERPLRFRKTAVLRAKAFEEDRLPSQAVGASYFVDDPPQSPIVSLIGDREHLFGKRAGALVKGSGRIPNYEKELEYPIHIEYFDGEGRRLIAQEGSFTASGHSARVNAQKSIALYARSAFGPERFSFNPFPERSYRDYKSLLLRSANSDANSTRLRDPVISSAAKGLGLLYQDALPIQVYINGEYWGHYNLREKINKYFIAAWEGVTRDSEIDRIDILARTGTDDYVQNGSNRDWLALMDFCRGHDLNDPASLQYVAERLDIDSLFRHSIFEMIIGNYDMTNVRVYRVPGGKWKYLLFDVEAGFLGLDAKPVNYYIKPKTARRAMFQHVHLAALLEVPEMRDRFLSEFGRILQAHFLWPDMARRFEPWERALESLLPRHVRRWPRGLNMKDWRVNVDAVKYYARLRPLRVIDHISKAMKLSRAEQEHYFGEARRLLEANNRR